MSNILLLGPYRPELISYLSAQGFQVAISEEPLPGNIDLKEISFIISYGYRHIIKKDVVEDFRGRAINLHISYLPWNRGSDPNLWSYLEDTPKGVSIHLIDEGLDTGDILVQKLVAGEAGDTLKTSYDRLDREIRALFYEYWPEIYNGLIIGVQQDQTGSYHRIKDKEPYEYLLTESWDTPVENLVGKALKREKGSV